MKKTISIIDSGVLRAMIDNDNSEKSVEIRDVMRTMKGERAPMIFICTSACLKRAIWEANSQVSITYLQEMIEFLEIVQSDRDVDYKNGEAVRAEIIRIAEAMSEVNHKKSITSK